MPGSTHPRPATPGPRSGRLAAPSQRPPANPAVDIHAAGGRSEAGSPLCCAINVFRYLALRAVCCPVKQESPPGSYLSSPMTALTSSTTGTQALADWAELGCVRSHQCDHGGTASRDSVRAFV